MNIDPKSETQSPDKQHFDKMLLKELVWKLDREVWAHVQNPSPNEEWSTSKAREETRNLISEYIGNYDALQSENHRLTEENGKLKELLSETEAVQDKTALILKTQTIDFMRSQNDSLTKINEELVKALQGVERLCDPENSAHENIWRIVYQAIPPTKPLNHEQS